MKYIVDRIEGDYAVCEAEDQSMVSVHLSMVPDNIKEGDHIVFNNGVYKKAQKDQKIRERIGNLMEDLWD